MTDPLFSGEELYKLIPQRPPIRMVDTLWAASQEEAETGLTISADNLFLQDGYLQTPGLIEHIAQSAAAFAGYSTYLRGEAPRLGYIGEIKKTHIFSLPPVGATLRTSIQLLGEAVGVSLVGAQTMLGDTLVADCQLKIFLKED